MSGDLYFAGVGEGALLAACQEFLLGDACGLRRLVTVNNLPDATLKFFTLDSCGRPTAFVHWSNELFPDAALASCSGSAVAKDILGGTLGKFVAMSILQGTVLSRSFVVYPILRSPNSRVGSKLAYLLASRVVSSWLCEIAKKTVRPVSDREMDTLVLRPLEYMANLKLLPVQYNALASTGLDRIRDSSWRPQVVFSHGDFWIGNVMFSPVGRWPGVPQVIDWGSSSVVGIPFFDSIRYIKSARLPMCALSATLKQQLIAINCSPSNGWLNLMAGLGQLGLERDQFPEARFAQLAIDTLKTYKAAVLNLPNGSLI